VLGNKLILQKKERKGISRLNYTAFTNPKVRLFDNNGIIVCQENIESSINGQQDKIGVIATNIFERCENRWLLIHHQGSSISNYMPANISPQ
jgi:SnoaL-like domain